MRVTHPADVCSDEDTAYKKQAVSPALMEGPMWMMRWKAVWEVHELLPSLCSCAAARRCKKPLCTAHHGSRSGCVALSAASWRSCCPACLLPGCTLRSSGSDGVSSGHSSCDSRQPPRAPGVIKVNCSGVHESSCNLSRLACSSCWPWRAVRNLSSAVTGASLAMQVALTPLSSCCVHRMASMCSTAACASCRAWHQALLREQLRLSAGAALPAALPEAQARLPLVLRASAATCSACAARALAAAARQAPACSC